MLFLDKSIVFKESGESRGKSVMLLLFISRVTRVLGKIFDQNLPCNPNELQTMDITRPFRQVTPVPTAQQSFST